jgi:hypothetical protein
VIFKYGSYAHQQDSVSFTIHSRQVKSGVGRRFYTQKVWRVRGRIRGTDQSDLTSKIQALEAAYVDGQDITVLLNDGTTSTAHSLANSSTMNGVRVMGGVNWLQGLPETGWGRTEYLYLRSFEVVLQAEVLDLESSILHFHETVQYRGGLTEYKAKGAFTGLPRQYIFQEFSPTIVVQTGVIVGATTWPTPPAPLFGLYRSPLSGADPQTPQIYGTNGNFAFPLPYKYVFELTIPSFLYPTVPSF